MVDRKRITYRVFLTAALVFVLGVVLFFGSAEYKRQRLWRSLRLKVEKELKAFEGKAGIVIRDLEKDWEIACLLYTSDAADE